MSAYCLKCGSYERCGCQPSLEALVDAFEKYDPRGEIAHKLAGKYRKKIEEKEESK